MVSATVRPVNTTWDLTGLMLPLIMSVVGISVLASCVIIIMIACLVRYRAKAKKHRNGKRMNTSHYKITVHAVEHTMCWSCGLQVYFYPVRVGAGRVKRLSPSIYLCVTVCVCRQKTRLFAVLPLENRHEITLHRSASQFIFFERCLQATKSD